MRYWKKGVALFIALVLTLTMQPIVANAEEAELSNVQSDEGEGLQISENEAEDPVGATIYTDIKTEESLVQTLATAQDDDTIEIGSNIYITKTIEITKNVTIDFKGNYSLIYVGEGAAIKITAPAGVEKVVLKNLELQVGTMGATGITVANGSKAELNKVTFDSRNENTNLTYIENSGTVDVIDSLFQVSTTDSRGIVNSVGGILNLTNASNTDGLFQIENDSGNIGILNYGTCTINGGLSYVACANSAIVDNYGNLTIEGGEFYSCPANGYDATVIRQQDYTKTVIKGGHIYKGMLEGKVSRGLLVANSYFQPDKYLDGSGVTQSSIGADEIKNGIPMIAEPTQDLSEDTHYLINIQTDDTTIDMKTNSLGLSGYYTKDFDVTGVSSDPNVASVDNNTGILTITGIGVTAVSVTIKTKDGSCIPGMQSSYFVSKCRVEVVDQAVLGAQDITGRILEDFSVIDPYVKDKSYHVSYHLKNQTYDNTAGGGAEAFCISGMGLSGDIADYFSIASNYEQPMDNKFTDTFYMIPKYVDENTLKFEQDGKTEFADSKVIINLEGTGGKIYNVAVSVNSIKLEGNKPVVTMKKVYPINSFYQSSVEQSPMAKIKNREYFFYDNLDSYERTKVGKNRLEVENAEFSLAAANADYELVNNQLRYKGNLESRSDTLECYVQVPGFYGKSKAAVKVKVAKKNPDITVEKMKDNLEGKTYYQQVINSKSNNNLVLDSVEGFIITGNGKFDETVENSILRTVTVISYKRAILANVALKAGQVLGKRESLTLKFKFKNSKNTVAVGTQIIHKKSSLSGETIYKLSEKKIIIDPSIIPVWDSKKSAWVDNNETQSFYINTNNNQTNKNVSKVTITNADGTPVSTELHFTATDMDFTGLYGKSVELDAKGGTPGIHKLKISFFDSSNALIKTLPLTIEVKSRRIIITDAKETIDLTVDRSSDKKIYGRIANQKDYFIPIRKNYEVSFSNMKVYNLSEVVGEVEKRNCITMDNADFDLCIGRNDNYDPVVSVTPKESVIQSGLYKPGHVPTKIELTYYDYLGRSDEQMVTISYKKNAPKLQYAKTATLYKNVPYVECNLNLSSVYINNDGIEVNNDSDRVVIKSLTITDINSPYDTRKAKNGQFYLLFKNHTTAPGVKDGKVNIRVEFFNSDKPVNLSITIKVKTVAN